MVLGIVAAILVGEGEERRLGLPKDTVIDLALAAVPCGIIGARLYYVAMSWESFASNPISILYIWEGGIAVYGSIIGGMLGVLLCARHKKLPYWRLIDALIPGVLLAQAIGRWGNYFNMEAYGAEIRNPLFQFFPLGVLIPQGDGYVWHMATFFYESLWDFCGFLALWRLRKAQHENGSTFCWYLLIYGSGRFIIEHLREDSLYLGNIRISQLLSLVLCAGGAAVLLWRAAKERRGCIAAAFVGTAALLARWFAFGDPWLYGGLLMIAAVCFAILAVRVGCKPIQLLWLALILLLDTIGLILPAALSLSFAGRVVSLVCSLTLPVYICWAVALLHSNDKENKPCP